MPRWAREQPDRLVYSSSRGGTWQGWTWELARGEHRRLTQGPVGNRTADISPDGESVIWFDDDTGDELGGWRTRNFLGGGTRDLVPGAPPSWESGLAWGGSSVLVGLADQDGFSIFTASAGPKPRARMILHQPQEVIALALSREDRYALISAADHGDSIHPDLKVLDAGDGSLVSQMAAKGLSHLSSAGFRPHDSEPCLEVNDDQPGHTRPLLWWPRRHEVQRLATGLRGEVEALDWFPDGGALLVRQLLDGRHRLWRLDLDPTRLTRIDGPAGTVEARVRPDGRVWALCSSAARPTRLLELPAGEEVLRPPGARSPRSVRFRNWRYETEGGRRIHGFLAVPRGNTPHPTVIWIHGGPHWHLDDSFSPAMAALVDHGLLVAAPNYRGSTGYGRDHRDQLNGNPGFPEVEDVARGVADLVAKGLADRERIVLMGASWGGYITLLGLGRHPDLFAGGVARVPVADYELAFAEESEPLQAMDRSLFGGSPMEVPELFRERSPMTYAAQVRAPVLVQAGENDSRCPYHQVEVYVRRLQELGREVTFRHYQAGHTAMVVDQDVALTAQVLEFLVPLLSLPAPPERSRLS
ncbi:MAG: alpha/beta fold hydrolase [Candidatus Dormibacteria bacterium]